MSRVNRFSTYLFVAALIFFGIGLYNLFSARFRIGDVYPAYSSLRADPLGTKVFFKALDGLDDINVERILRPLSGLTGDKDTTLFVLGVDRAWMETGDPDIYRALSWLTASGGRLVISLYPSAGAGGSDALDEEEGEAQDKGDEEGGENGQVNGEVKDKDMPGSLSERWGLDIASSEGQAEMTADLEKDAEGADLPSSVKWGSGMYFTQLDKGWDVIYARKGLPVLIEKRSGPGSIVLCADSFFFSNEAMMSERHPGLLAWLAGQGHEIRFDESHLGIGKDTGIADLARKYGLQGVFLTLLLIAGLFLWRVSTHFMPPLKGNKKEETWVRGETDYLDGLTGLLQHNIPQKDLLNTCLKEWEKSFAGDRGLNRQGASMARELMHSPEIQGDPVEAYNKICDKISERKRL